MSHRGGCVQVQSLEAELRQLRESGSPKRPGSTGATAVNWTRVRSGRDKEKPARSTSTALSQTAPRAKPGAAEEADSIQEWTKRVGTKGVPERWLETTSLSQLVVSLRQQNTALEEERVAMQRQVEEANEGARTLGVKVVSRSR